MKVNITRIIKRINKIAEYGIDETGGWSRYSFSDADIEVKRIVSEWAKELGMFVRTDQAGNWIAHLNGINNDLPPVAMGSHLDTVKNGGKYDGVYGVMSALEVINVLKENNYVPKSPIEIIAFAEEEGSGFGASLFGSKAMAGVAADFYIKKRNDEGLSLGDAMKKVGCDPNTYKMAMRERGSIKNYVELHIEQGRILESSNKSIGVVQGIVGFKWAKMIISGRADHAGATPMGMREDTMIAAGIIATETERIANEIGNPLVATVGKIMLKPNSINIVPGEAEVYFDIRDISSDNIDRFVEMINISAKKICNARDLTYKYEELANAAPVSLSNRVVDIVEESAGKCGYSSMRMYSGAGHDAQLMSLISDAGMIFVPSKNGISHAPQEYTSDNDLEKGANVLLNTVLKLADI
jgi:amidase, hydantoinase/carbamoylase family